MTDTLLLVAAFAAAYAGMATLALAQPAHWGSVTHRPPPPQTRRRTSIGTALLVAASAIAVVRDGWSFGLLLTMLLFGLGAAAVIATLTLRPRWLRLLAFGVRR